MIHFDLEAVPVRFHARKIDRLKGTASPTLEASCRIPNRHSGDPLHVVGGSDAQNETFEGPVDHADPAGVTGANRHVGVRFADSGNEFRNILRGVGKIGIHLNHKVVALLQSPVEPGDIGTSQTVLRLARENVEAWFGGRSSLDPLTCPVRRTVINDQNSGDYPSHCRWGRRPECVLTWANG